MLCQTCPGRTNCYCRVKTKRYLTLRKISDCSLLNSRRICAPLLCLTGIRLSLMTPWVTQLMLHWLQPNLIEIPCRHWHLPTILGANCDQMARHSTGKPNQRFSSWATASSTCWSILNKAVLRRPLRSHAPLPSPQHLFYSTTLIVGNLIIKNIHFLNTVTHCFPGVTVPVILVKLPR